MWQNVAWHGQCSEAMKHAEQVMHSADLGEWDERLCL